jgi:hypothetical protein
VHALLQTLIARLMKMLTRRGVLVEEMGQAWLAEPDADGEEARTHPAAVAGGGHHLPHRLRSPRHAEGAHPERLSVDTGPPLRADLCLAKGSRLQARARPAGPMPREATVRQPLCADIDGFSLHAAVRVEVHDRKRLEQLCRYITRPPCRPRRASGPALRQAQTVHRTV